MRFRATLAALTALAISTPGMAAVQVQVSGESVDIQATNAPLAEILDRLSRQTRMKIVYEGAPPRQMISLDLRGRTPVEAVVAALEGQGVNYALAMDATGTRVETLLVSGTASTGGGKPVGAAEDRRSAAREMPPEPIVEEPEPVPEEEGQVPADTGAAVAMPTAQQGAQGRNRGRTASRSRPRPPRRAWVASRPLPSRRPRPSRNRPSRRPRRLPSTRRGGPASRYEAARISSAIRVTASSGSSG